MRELTEPIDLCRSDGRLDEAAVGWSRRPLVRPNLRGWGRAKRWEYWGVVTDRFCVGIVVSALDYAGVCSLWVLDRETGRTWESEAVPPLGRGVTLPPEYGGVASVTAGHLHIEVSDSALRATAPGVEVDLAVAPGAEVLGVVVPWSSRRFQYTVKDVSRPVSGRIVVDGTSYDVEGWGVLDHGRGKWPYSITWNWAAGSGPGRGLTLGGKWTDRTGITENGLFVDGRLHKIHADLVWEYDPTDWLRPWRVHGEGIDARFTPFHEKVSRTNLGVVANETHQCFGHWTGWAATDAGERVDLEGLVGWAEEARNRW
ncbi:DUF2804 family protein [Nocardioides sp. MAH-18]|uniref:DUF2804 family protein n=1 Tax=Nocardioides agri TaxID=2682843 RepID=A0A6L6XVX5_9ACTN|nr:DUF2804 domain-containing protein [Nocardioides sp. CGMCC 1.13656]MBA2954851.1 DUF2804 domain-containing protein [Nocardioides sp. CGMCC 1.13656]MVQ49705.1 DUF2804 family protein [Nocardioides sp. MAH-18]